MASALTNFYEIPSWLEDMPRVQRTLAPLMDSLAVFQSKLDAMPNIIAVLDSPVLREISNLKLSTLHTPGMIHMLQREQEILAKFAPLVDSQINAISQLPNWTQFVFDHVPYQYDSLRTTLEETLTRWTALADQLASEVDFDGFTPEMANALSEEDQDTLSCEITSALSDEKNWDQRLWETIENFQKTHPTLVWVLKCVLLSILVNTIGNLLTTAIGQALFPAKIYEEPNTASQVIYHIEQHQTLIVVGDVPYYYEVEIRDCNTDQTMAGYISKRSVRIIDGNSSPQS